MDNFTLRIENNNISETVVNEIFNSFKKRIGDEITEDTHATLVINPNLDNYKDLQIEPIGIQNYIFEQDGNILSDEKRMRLMAFAPSDKSIKLLFILTRKNKIINMSANNQTVWLPKDQIVELNTLVKVICSFENNTNLIFTISGEAGIGKTYFVKQLANKLKRCIHRISYNDLDGENTGSISKKIEGIFSNIKKEDIILIEEADDFLSVGESVNHFVKNALCSKLNSTTGFIVFVETENPTKLNPAILRSIFRHIYIRSLDEKSRLEYLNYFLEANVGYSISDEVFKAFDSTGLTVRDLEQVSFYTRVFKENDNALQQAFSEVCNSKISSSLTSDSPLFARKPRYKLEDLILPDEKISAIKYAISLLDNTPVVYDKWNVKSIDPYPRAVLNFYGAPGTGKTMCAHAIAEYLHKDLLALNYAEIESKYIGDAPKKLESAFSYARQHNVVMFFDEADSFLGKRIENVSHSADQALNSLRSTMLIQLEMYEGIVIFATNLRDNYDKAFQSRFLYEIGFDLPDDACRKRLIDNYIEKLLPIKNAHYSEEEINSIVTKSAGLSGREIKSAFIQAMNQLAYISDFKNVGNASEIYMPLDIILSSIEDKAKLLPKVSVSTSSDETKKAIGTSLLKSIKSENKKDLGNGIISLSYMTAWADNNISKKELNAIERIKESYPDSKDYSSDGEDIARYKSCCDVIKKHKAEKEALTCLFRVLYSDDIVDSNKRDFIEKFISTCNIPHENTLLIEQFVKAEARYLGL